LPFLVVIKTINIKNMGKLYIEKKYGQAPNELLNDPNISLRAKGLFTFLQSKPDGWSFSINRISQQTSDGETSVRSAIKELEEGGYLKRESTRKKDGKWDGYDYILSESPSLDSPMTDSSMSDKYHTLSKKDNSKKDIVKKNISIAESEDSAEEEEFFFKEKLEKMKFSEDYRMRIIHQYWTFKGFNYNNKDKYESAIKRELRPAGLLKGYSWGEIEKAMKWLEINSDFKWTLESVHKYIDEVDYLESK